ncbi:MAG: hypothetical protein BJG00_018095 [Limnothrix sp. CACIAM 69d]|nr:MAG: hypothetical protein BJG00_018095 [Limnothrix sp. CACIAM 69d]
MIFRVLAFDGSGFGLPCPKEKKSRSIPTAPGAARQRIEADRSMLPSKLAPSRAIDPDPPRFASIHRDHGSQRNNNQQNSDGSSAMATGNWQLATGN